MFTADSVYIPSELMQEHERGSVRGRLTALSRTLACELGHEAPVRCIVDRDYDEVLDPVFDNSSWLLMRTDYSTTEMYFANVLLVEQVFSDFLRMPPVQTEQLLKDIMLALADAASILAANQSLGLKCSHLSLERCCKFDRGSGLRFDSSDYIVRYLSKGAALAHRDDFILEVDRIRSSAPSDGRHWVRGRDFLPLLSFVLKNHGIDSGQRRLQNLEGAFTLATDAVYLRQFPLFRTLESWHLIG